MGVSFAGGEGGIRTLGTLLGYTRFPVVHLQPLGHLSLLKIQLLACPALLLNRQCLQNVSTGAFLGVLLAVSTTYHRKLSGAKMKSEIDESYTIETPKIKKTLVAY